jgi:hypothetical protein
MKMPSKLLLLLAMLPLLVGFQNCEVKFSGPKPEEVERVICEFPVEKLALGSYPIERIEQLTYERSGFYPPPNAPSYIGALVTLDHRNQSIGFMRLDVTTQEAQQTPVSPFRKYGPEMYHRILRALEDSYLEKASENSPVSADRGDATLKLTFENNQMIEHLFETSDDIRGKTVIVDKGRIEEIISELLSESPRPTSIDPIPAPSEEE